MFPYESDAPSQTVSPPIFESGQGKALFKSIFLANFFIKSLFKNSDVFLVMYSGSQIYLSLILKTTLVASTTL